MPRIKDQAICIRSTDWSQTSQLMTLLTRSHGKISGLAKGSKRTSPGAVARYSGGIELLTRGQVVATLKSTSDLASITEWDLQQPYMHLRQHWAHQQMSMYAADITHALIADHDPHASTFDALAHLLDDLQHESQGPWSLLAYQWALLAECGYQPRLDRDARHGQELAKQTTYCFDPKLGGLTDQRVQSSTHTGHGPWGVRGETVELLKQVHALEPRSPDVTSASLGRANRLLCVYIRFVLDKHLPTMDYLLGA